MSALLHPKTARQLDAIQAAPLGSVIFHGPRALGKATAARQLAAALNCTGGQPGVCANCRQIAAGNFPDFIWIERTDKASITLEQVRGLTGGLSLKPYQPGATRVVVIDQAHLLTTEAQNALLKLLEEPPPATLIVLIAEHIEALLLTVRSRCRTVQFIRPEAAAIAQLLTDTQGLTGPQAAQLAAASAGSPGAALNLAAHPAEAEALLALAQDAQLPGGRSLFDRLLLAAKLVAAGADLERFGEALHRRIINALETGELEPATASPWLAALERFRTHLRAKVSPRVALERLMLELG
jgi:DNA polymerase-3 subunit delta'